MRATIAVGRAAPGVVELQETGFCTCCMATKPLRNVREWGPAFTSIDGGPLRTGECAGCGSTIEAARQARRLSDLIGAAVFIVLALAIGYYEGWKDGLKEGRRRTLHGQRLRFRSHLAGRRSGVLR